MGCSERLKDGRDRESRGRSEGRAREGDETRRLESEFPYLAGGSKRLRDGSVAGVIGDYRETLSLALELDSLAGGSN